MLGNDFTGTHRRHEELPGRRENKIKNLHLGLHQESSLDSDGGTVENGQWTFYCHLFARPERNPFNRETCGKERETVEKEEEGRLIIREMRPVTERRKMTPTPNTYPICSSMCWRNFSDQRE